MSEIVYLTRKEELSCKVIQASYHLEHGIKEFGFDTVGTKKFLVFYLFYV
jgi:hypothetical protein